MIEFFFQAYSLPLIAEVKYPSDYFSEYPQQIHVGKEAAVLYTRQPGYYAIHYKQPNAATSPAVLVLNGGKIAVFAGEPEPTTTDIITPVYTLPAGAIAVPTGLVFVRFAENVAIESQTTAINQAGYKIAQSLDYAPHAAWLQARSGKISDALQNIADLEALPNLENIEPQMLTAPTYK